MIAEPNATDPIIARWIGRNSHDKLVGVEFGAGRFNYTQQLKTRARIGVEIFEPYVRDFNVLGVRKVAGDMRQYRNLGLPEFDVALIVDALEHIPKDEGLEFLECLREDCSRILLYVPEGNWPQESDPWGYYNPHQSHQSEWSPEDFDDRWVITRWLDLGRNPTMFGVWNRDGSHDAYFLGVRTVRGPHAGPV